MLRISDNIFFCINDNTNWQEKEKTPSHWPFNLLIFHFPSASGPWENLILGVLILLHHFVSKITTDARWMAGDHMPIRNAEILKSADGSSYNFLCAKVIFSLSLKDVTKNGMREKAFFCNNYQGFHFVLDYFISPWKEVSVVICCRISYFTDSAEILSTRHRSFHQMSFNSLSIQKCMSEKFQLLLS